MNNAKNQVYLYGFDKDARVVRYAYINHENFSTKEIIFQANNLVMNCPNIVEIFMVDNCYEVYKSCRDSMKTQSVENRVVFKVFLEKEGIRIL